MTAGLIAATILVTSTTIDDAVWLIPYCASPHLPTLTKVIHGATFIITLEFLAIFCVVVSYVFQSFLLRKSGGDSDIDTSFILDLAGAIICWTIAIALYIKKILKRRRRAMAAAAAASEPNSNRAEVSSESTSLIVKDEEHQEANVKEKDDDDDDDDDDDTSVSESEGGDRDIPSSPSPLMIASLTTLGALDEISYFPALLVGQVFSPFELCVGTLVASVIILTVVLLFLSKFKPLVDFLDSIPLYGIVGAFAVILTAGLFLP